MLSFIIDEVTLRSASDMKAIVRILEQTFKTPDYLREVRTTDKNWLEVSADEAIEKIISFLKKK